MGDTDLTPFDMGTFGSRTTPTMAPQLRKAAAAAREMLIDLAAQQLNVEPGSVRIVDARFVNHDKSKSLSFADVAKGKQLVKVIPDNVATTAPKDWTIAGTSAPKVDGRDFVTGQAPVHFRHQARRHVVRKSCAPLGFQCHAGFCGHENRRSDAGRNRRARRKLYRHRGAGSANGGAR